MVAQLMKYLYLCEDLSVCPSVCVKPGTAVHFLSTHSGVPRQADSQSWLIGQYSSRFIERPCLRVKMENEKDLALVSGSPHTCAHMGTLTHIRIHMNTQNEIIKIKSLCPEIIGFKAQHRASSLTFPRWGMSVSYASLARPPFLLQMATFLTHICNNQGLVGSHVFSVCCKMEITARLQCFLSSKKVDADGINVPLIPRPELTCETDEGNHVSLKTR